MSDTSTLATRNPRNGQSDHAMPVFDAEQVAAVARELRQAQPAILRTQPQLDHRAERVDARHEPGLGRGWRVLREMKRRQRQSADQGERCSRRPAEFVPALIHALYTTDQPRSRELATTSRSRRPQVCAGQVSATSACAGDDLHVGERGGKGWQCLHAERHVDV